MPSYVMYDDAIRLSQGVFLKSDYMKMYESLRISDNWFVESARAAEEARKKTFIPEDWS